MSDGAGIRRGVVEHRDHLPTTVGPYQVAGVLHGTEVLVGLDPAGDPVAVRRLASPVPAAARARLLCLEKATPAGSPLIVAHDLDGRSPWVAAELVRGVDLDSALDAHGPLGPVETSNVAMVLGGVLAALHADGLALGPVELTDVLLAEDGPWLATLATSAEEGDEADDVLAWAELVVEAGTGAPPPDAVGSSQDLVPGLDLELLDLLDAALDADPGERPDSQDLLRCLLGGFVPANPAPLVRSVIGRTWQLAPALAALGRPRPPIRLHHAPAVAEAPRRRGLFRRR